VVEETLNGEIVRNYTGEGDPTYDNVRDYIRIFENEGISLRRVNVWFGGDNYELLNTMERNGDITFTVEAMAFIR
jgi:hypothetical protein